MLNPLESTGWLTSTHEAGQPRFIGSCFAFRRRDRLLTAAHCIRGLPLDSIGVHLLGRHTDDASRVTDSIIHPDADVAILCLEPDQALPDRFAGDTSVYDWGMTVSAFGYPEDSSATGMQPTARYFRGNIQRMFRHDSHFGFRYDAVELSFGAPGGLSGGPVTPGSDYGMVMGLVTENATGTTYLSTTAEEVTPTFHRKEIIHSVINYTVAVRLDTLHEWFDEHIPYLGAVV